MTTTPSTASLNAPPSTAPDQPEPGGPGQSLPAAGILALSAASLGADAEWLRAYLSRALSGSSGLKLSSGARAAIIEQAVDYSDTAQRDRHHRPIIDALNAYLCATDFRQDAATPLIAALLHADVVAATTYDARAREALMRAVTALHLPPRVLYTAEAALAALVQSLRDASVDGVPEDERRNRRRKGMRWLKVGAAGVVGGVAIGLSGGLIAPALIPALTSLGISTTALGSSGVMAVGSLFGAAGATVGAAAMASRTGMVEEFVFEPCASGLNTNPDGSDVRNFKSGGPVQHRKTRISPREPVKDVVVRWRDRGGLFVWELLTSQEHLMVIPGLISFSVGFVSEKDLPDSDGEEDDGMEVPNKSVGNKRVTWLLPEEEMEVGGLDKDNLSKGRRRRVTGAITVPGAGSYVLRFVLKPGSLPVTVVHRAAVVPLGKEPPAWVSEESEQQLQQDLVTSSVRSLSFTILVPGLVTTASKDTGPYPGMCADEFASTAATLDKFGIQCFALRWDSELLMELSDALRSLVKKMALSMATQRGMLAVPVMAGLAGVATAAALPISILAAIRTIIGNIWARALSHAEECGYMLAAELASRSLGNRPVVLAGYSVGATVIFHCLKELARRGLVGLVHEAYFVGAACPADVASWREIRTVVSGRVVNVFNPRDWYLELYHKGANLGSVAGTRPIKDAKGIARIENFDLDKVDVITDHTDYAKRFNEILFSVGFGNSERRRLWRDLVPFEHLSDDEGDGEEQDKEHADYSRKKKQSNMVFEQAWTDDEDSVVSFETTRKELIDLVDKLSSEVDDLSSEADDASPEQDESSSAAKDPKSPQLSEAQERDLLSSDRISA